NTIFDSNRSQAEKSQISKSLSASSGFFRNLCLGEILRPDGNILHEPRLGLLIGIGTGMLRWKNSTSLLRACHQLRFRVDLGWTVGPENDLSLTLCMLAIGKDTAVLKNPCSKKSSHLSVRIIAWAS